MFKEKFYLLFVYILIFNYINLSTSTDSNSQTLDLIVDVNKINSNGSVCGDSLNNSCNSIQDAINYFSNFKKQPVKLVDGTYRGDFNSFSFYGWNVTISSYTIGSNQVIIDGTTLEKTFILILKLNSTSNNSILKISNINFINFNKTFLSSFLNNNYTKITFDSCQFSNCNNDFNIHLNGPPTSSSSSSSSSSNNEFNSIDFINTKFEQINTTSQLFNFVNFKVHFISSIFKTITLGNSFYNNILGGNSLLIDSSTFNEIQITNGKEFLTTFRNGSLIIKNSEFNNISNSFLINVNYNSDLINITNNIFTNINDGFIHLLNGDVNLAFNKISNYNNNNNKNVIDASDSSLYLHNNTFNYPNTNRSIICVGSKIIFTNNGGAGFNLPICSQCNLIYNGIQICPTSSSSDSTTSVSITTTTTTNSFTTSTSTTSGKHTNNSIDSKKSVSHSLLCFLLVLITLLNL
ncbi:hypothetical protein ACTFIZ_001886 [Dictyostelium cf. discoideum]